MSKQRFLDPLARGVRLIDGFNEAVGRFVAWLIPLMVVLTVYDVIMRKFFASGSVMLQELEWHLFALSFLLGAAYTLKHDDHVRVDVIYQSRRITARGRDWINLLGGLFLLTPFCLLIIISAWPFVMDAFRLGEGSPDGGLPYRWLLKAAIPLGFALLLLQGWAESLRALLRLLGHETEGKPEENRDVSEEAGR